MLGTLEGDSFILESMNESRRATPMSVAAHGLYEQADPLTVSEPEGTLHLADSKFEAVDERRCRASGGRWEPATQFSVKIEGATRVGARAVYFAGSADPVFIAKADEIAASVEAMVRDLVPPADPDKPYDLYFRFYGLGAVSNRPVDTSTGRSRRPGRMHRRDARKKLTPSLPLPSSTSCTQPSKTASRPPAISPSPSHPRNSQPAMPIASAVYHVMEVDDLAPLFPVTVHDIG